MHQIWCVLWNPEGMVPLLLRFQLQVPLVQLATALVRLLFLLLVVVLVAVPAVKLTVVLALVMMQGPAWE